MMTAFKYFADPGGWRFVALVKKGRKEIRLLDIGTLEIHKVAARDENQLVPIKTRGIAKLIQDKVRLYKRCGLGVPRAAVKSALLNLKTAKAGVK